MKILAPFIFIMEDTVNENNPVLNVYEVFKDYYGEERVDIQYNGNSTDIIVYFPKVTVTNEYSESVDITDVYVKTGIESDGIIKGPFTMTRGSYTLSQVYNDYVHSHARSIPSSYEFTSCCLGSGPIGKTIALLSLDCDLDRWALYCYELDKYMQVESIAGHPFHRLSDLSKSIFAEESIELDYADITTDSEYSQLYTTDLIKRFVKYLVKQDKLVFCIKDNHYYIALSFIQYISLITTTFVEFLHTVQDSEIPLPTLEECIQSNILLKGTYRENKFYKKVRRNRYGRNVSGNTACIFKGKRIIVTVENDLSETDDSKDIIMNPHIANFILYKILVTLNYAVIFETDDTVIL